MNNQKQAGTERPYTAGELFNIIVNKLKEQGLLKGIDYALPNDREERPIDSYYFNLQSTIEYGGSEGAYLELVAFFDRDNQVTLGTIKTLDSSRAGMRELACIGAECVVQGTEFINDNLSHFEWKGFEIHNTNEPYHYAIRDTLEEAKKARDFEFERGAKEVIIIDRSAKKEYVYVTDEQ